MPQNLPLTGVTVPVQGDTDQVAIDVYSALTGLEPYMVPRFPSEAVGNAAITTPADGQLRVISNPSALQRYDAATTSWGPTDPVPVTFSQTNTGPSATFNTTVAAQWTTANYSITPTRTGYADVFWTVDLSTVTAGFGGAFLDIRRDGVSISQPLTNYGASAFFFEIVTTTSNRQVISVRSLAPQLLRNGVSTSFTVFVFNSVNGGGWKINDSSFKVVQQ